MKKKLLIFASLLLSINIIYSQTSWELLNPRPTANTGKEIFFISADHGYIITSNELLETLDAGNFWQKKQNVSSANDMSFYNNIGFIVGNFGYVLMTVNSGTTWTQISTGFNNSFNTVNIIDESNIILSSPNNIVKSNDGGTTWESLNILNVTVNKTFFTSSLTGHAVCNGGTILKTVDGGLNWYTTQSTNTIPSDFFTIYFINETTGFASQEHDDIYKTIDGGETWMELSGFSSAVYNFYFLDENSGFCVGEHGATFKTTDGGITWNPILFQNGYYDNTSMYGIYFTDNNIGYATGARGRIIKTSDGGNSWSHHSPTYNDFMQLQFIDSNIGYAQSGNDFYKTTDNGNTWFLVGSLILESYDSNSDFTFVDQNLGYATTGGSHGGKVIKTINGGVTWIALNNGSSILNEGITSIYFKDEHTGIISGGFNNPKVLKTIDGGNNWTQVFNQKFGKIQFINDSVGFGNRVGHYNGAIYKTTDGGNTWDIIIELEGEEINDYHFLDENYGYFVGDQGLIFKTIDGGTNLEELEIPYEWYTKVNFFTKNVGYVADEDGRLYRTMNGGLKWELLTQQKYINSIELVDDKIFTAGSNGKIFRSDIEYEMIVLNVNPAEDISNSRVKITGNVASNEGVITGIQFEYSSDNSFDNIIPMNPGSIEAFETLSLSADITGLNPNTKYYFRLKAINNSIDYTSQILSFTTLSDYEISTFYTAYYTSTTAVFSANVISNEHDITDIEFQYGISSDSLIKSSSGTPSIVAGNTTEYIVANIDDLQPKTQYYYRVKAIHQDEHIYGNILSFSTYPKYEISLFNPGIWGGDVHLSANIISHYQDINDIVFEYGSISYENQIVTNPSHVNAHRSAFVMATLSDLDTDSIYYYRLKAMHSDEAIFSQEGVFNLSGEIIMVSGTIKEEAQTNSLFLGGLINSYGSHLTDIHFEYGITDGFGSSVSGTPDYVFGNNTYLITATISNPLSNQKYYYRLIATHNGNTIYSDTYHYTTGLLSIDEFVSEEQVSIYPNPTTGDVRISIKDYRNVSSIELYNIMGEPVHIKNMQDVSDVIVIDTSILGKGLYLLKVNFEKSKPISSKLIIY